MLRQILTAAALLAVFTVTDAPAVNLADTTVVIPIIGRFPGANNTQWRTDVFVSNHSTVTKTVTAQFYVSGGSLMERSFTLAPFNDVELRDIVLNQFGLPNAAGLLILTTTGGSSFDARARIYNAGNPAGEFGQGVPGIGMINLRRQAFMYGLSGTGGNRLNVGVANPSNKTITVTYLMRTGSNQLLASGSLSVGPFQVVQVNDVFAVWGVPPQANVSIEFNTFDDPIYGYASEVRNDTGDAVFLFGQGPNA